MVRKWTRHPKRGTVYSPETWEGDRRPTTLTLAQSDEPDVSPDVVLWGDADHGLVVAQEVLMPGAAPQAIADMLRKAIRQPAPGGGPPRQPRRVRVRRREIADAIRPVTESLGIELELVESLPFLDQVFRDLETRFGTPGNQGYLDATDISEELLREMFSAAAALYRAKPWKSLPEGEPLLLESRAWDPSSRYALVMGGRVRAVAFYDSWQDLTRLYGLPEGGRRQEEAARRIRSLAVMFTRVSTLGPRRAAEPRDHGWEVATRSAYPLVMGLGSGRESHWPTPGEARVLTGALQALAHFAADMAGGRLAPVSRYFLTGEYAPRVLGEEVPVSVTCTTLSTSES